MSLPELVQSIIADKIVDADEVAALEAEIYADDTVDTAEVDALFTINDACSGNANDAGFNKLFVKAIGDNVMADGKIDDDEVAMLVQKIGNDGQTDALELELLASLKERNGGTLPAALEALTVQ